MKRIYFATSYLYRKDYESLYRQLKSMLSEKYGIELYSFVFEYGGSVKDKDLMSEDFKELDKTDVILAEVTYKSIGVGIEVGYIKAQGKKIIYLHKDDVEVENTINGTADFVINYSNEDDVLKWFKENITKII